MYRGTTPRMSGTERHPSQPSSISSVSGVTTGLISTVSGMLGRVRVAGIAVHLDHADLLERVHLGRGEAGAIVLAHGLDHVVDEALGVRGPDLLRGDGLGELSQDRVAEARDFQDGHVSLLLRDRIVTRKSGAAPCRRAAVTPRRHSSACTSGRSRTGTDHCVRP